MRLSAPILLPLLLCACTSPLQELREINPPANDFASSLASEYLDYAESEAEQSRKLSAEYYANKGLKALKGKTALPEEPKTSLPEADASALAHSRAELLTLMNDNMKRVAAQKLARAQVLFDCWQYQLTHRIAQEKAPCKEEFLLALERLRDIAESFYYENKISHSLFFAPNTIRLTHETRMTLDRIAREALAATDYRIEIDSVKGGSDDARRIDEKRRAAVQRALEKQGIDPKRIKAKEDNESQKVLLSHDDEDVPERPDQMTITLKTHQKNKE